MPDSDQEKLYLHGVVEIPPRKTVGDLLEVFQGVKHEIFAGRPNRICAGCRKPFDAVRKARKAVRMYPVQTRAPIAFSYNICGSCLADIRNGGDAKQRVFASVAEFCDGN